MPTGIPVTHTDAKTGLHKPGFSLNQHNVITCKFSTTREWHDAITRLLPGWGCATVSELLAAITPYIPDTRPEPAAAAAAAAAYTTAAAAAAAAHAAAAAAATAPFEASSMEVVDEDGELLVPDP